MNPLDRQRLRKLQAQTSGRLLSEKVVGQGINGAARQDADTLDAKAVPAVERGGGRYPDPDRYTVELTQDDVDCESWANPLIYKTVGAALADELTGNQIEYLDEWAGRLVSKTLTFSSLVADSDTPTVAIVTSPDWPAEITARLVSARAQREGEAYRIEATYTLELGICESASEALSDAYADSRYDDWQDERR